MSQNFVNFDNGITIKIGDTIEVQKKHFIGFISTIFVRGIVLSIHKDQQVFRVRTEDGITMFRFQDTKFIGRAK